MSWEKLCLETWPIALVFVTTIPQPISGVWAPMVSTSASWETTVLCASLLRRGLFLSRGGWRQWEPSSGSSTSWRSCRSVWKAMTRLWNLPPWRPDSAPSQVGGPVLNGSRKHSPRRYSKAVTAQALESDCTDSILGPTTGRPELNKLLKSISLKFVFGKSGLKITPNSCSCYEDYWLTM